MKPTLLAAVALCLAGTAVAQQVAPARISVRVPAGAKLFIDDVAVPLTRETGSFNTPNLEPGERYSYVLRLEMPNDGKTVKVERKVYVRAGQTTAVDFGDREAVLAAARAPTLPPPEVVPVTGIEPAPTKTDRPQGMAPIPQVVAFKDGKVTWEEIGTRFVEKKQKVLGPDGKEEDRAVIIPETFKHAVEFDVKKLKVYGTDGKEVDAARLPELLKEPTAVFLCHDQAAPDSYYLKYARPGALFLVLPPPEAPKFDPPPPPPEKKS